MVVLFAMATYLVGDFTIIKGVNAIETTGAEMDMRQLRRHFRAVEAHLSGLVVDWACWDEIYSYVASNKNQEFLKKYFNELSMKKLLLHSAAIFKEDGHLDSFTDVHGQNHDATFFKEEIAQVTKLAHFIYASEIDTLVGFLQIQDCPFVIAVHRIFDSNKQKRTNALLILTSAFNREYIEETQHMVDYDFSILPPKAFSHIKEGAIQGTPYKITYDDDTTHIYSLVHDVFGDAAFCLELRRQRTIAALGMRMSRHNFFLMLILGLSFLLASLTFLHRTEKSIARRELERRLHRDPLTDLANRTVIPQGVADTMATADKNGHLAGVFFIHLNRLKEVNDSYGYDRGDELIREVATRLLHHASPGFVARSGGDKFLVAAEITHQSQCESLANSLIDSLLSPFVINDDEVHIGADIGVALYPAHGKDARQLVHRAELAMFEGRARGNNMTAFFSKDIEVRAARKLKLESSLYEALESEALSVHYQPKVRVASKDVAGCEALVRWQGKDGKFIPPPLFIPLAEECGLVTQIDMFVLRTACRQVKQWHKEGLAVPVAVNMSTRSILSPGFCDTVLDILREENVPPTLIDLEITETCFMSNMEAALTIIERLHGEGLHFALDDFGTGYSSLQYLSSMPISCLKIDKKFVDDIFSGKKTAQALIKSILSLASNLGMTTVSEGVEDRGQLDFLLANGASVIQGYLFSKPLNAEDCTTFLRESHSRISSVMDVPANCHATT